MGLLRRREKQRCPRRVEGIGSREPGEPDGWSPGHGFVNSREESCTFCGSLRPERVLELVRAGYVLGPTDKNYKVYVGSPVSDEEAEARYRKSLPPGVAEDQVDERQKADLKALSRSGGQDIGKFYFQHFSADQCREFVELLNAGTVKIGYPGRFYVLPFFVSRDS